MQTAPFADLAIHHEPIDFDTRTRFEKAAIELRQSMKWIVVAAGAFAIAALWYVSLFSELTMPIALATIAGVFLSVLLGSGLFAAA